MSNDENEKEEKKKRSLLALVPTNITSIFLLHSLLFWAANPKEAIE